MIKYLRQANGNLLESLVSDTVRTADYVLTEDQSDQDYYAERKSTTIDRVLYRKCLQQLKDPFRPLIVYSNYQKYP
jgi:hypothetical protein